MRGRFSSKPLTNRQNTALPHQGAAPKVRN
jgi:hypothetical protein